MKNDLDYTILNDRPYDNELNRSPSTVDNGSVEDKPVKSEGALGDVWIDSFIKSTNYSPKKTGFYIDGLTGYAEFSNAYIVGKIYASIGEIGGFIIGPDYIRDINNSFGLSSQSDILNIYGEDVRFWAGATFENRENAPFLIRANGEGVLSGFIFESEGSLIPGHKDRIYSILDADSPAIEINASDRFIRVGKTNDPFDMRNITLNGQTNKLEFTDLNGDWVGEMGVNSGAYLDIFYEDALRIGEPSTGDPLKDRFLSSNSIWPAFDAVNFLGINNNAWRETMSYVYSTKIYNSVLDDYVPHRNSAIVTGLITSTGSGSFFFEVPGYAADNWSVTKLSTGKYRITHNIGHQAYTVACSAINNHHRHMIEDISDNSFTVSWQETNYVSESFSVSGGMGGSVTVSGVRSSSNPEVSVDVTFYLTVFVYPDIIPPTP